MSAPRHEHRDADPPPQQPRDHQNFRAILSPLRRRPVTLTTSTLSAVTKPHYADVEEFLANGITKVDDCRTVATYSPAKASDEVTSDEKQIKKATDKKTHDNADKTADSTTTKTDKSSRKKSRKSTDAASPECPICYNAIAGKTTRNREEAVRITTCGHVFGRTCLETHVKSGHPSSRFCPMCRAELWGLSGRSNGVQWVRLEDIEFIDAELTNLRERTEEGLLLGPVRPESFEGRAQEFDEQIVQLASMIQQIQDAPDRSATVRNLLGRFGEEVQRSLGLQRRFTHDLVRQTEPQAQGTAAPTTGNATTTTAETVFYSEDEEY